MKNDSNGCVTIDNFDWYMDSLLQVALSEGRAPDYEALKTIYVTVLWESIKFHVDIAQKNVRPLTQVCIVAA
ncbi:MAG: hypothetical protein ACI93R_001531 [Flavobacteriales bacterium]